MSAQSTSARIPEQVVVRFWAKVNKYGPLPESNPELGPCWLWTASLRNKGYGAFAYTIDGELVQDRAHRISFFLHGGILEPQECVLHHCDVPSCVNPRHLFAGTKAVNNEDMRVKGRHVSGGSKTPKTECKYERGVSHHAAILTPEIVQQIRADKVLLSYSSMAKKYRISTSHLHRIIHRKAWSHVE